MFEKKKNAFTWDSEKTESGCVSALGVLVFMVIYIAAAFALPIIGHALVLNSYWYWFAIPAAEYFSIAALAVPITIPVAAMVVMVFSAFKGMASDKTFIERIDEASGKIAKDRESGKNDNFDTLIIKLLFNTLAQAVITLLVGEFTRWLLFDVNIVSWFA